MKKFYIVCLILFPAIFTSCILENCDDCTIEDEMIIDFVYTAQNKGIYDYTICVSDASNGVPAESQYTWNINGGDPKSFVDPNGGCSDVDVSIFQKGGVDVSISLNITTPNGKRYSEVKIVHLEN